MNSGAALICIDLVNEMVDPSGKLAGKGYADFATRHGVLERVGEAQAAFRSAGQPVIHVRLGFSPGYPEHPERSPLFGQAKKNQALLLGTSATEFAGPVRPVGNDPVVAKPRVSAFYGTPLEAILRSLGIATVYLAGVATDLGVEAAARDAHDRDYEVVVLADCCVAATDEVHENALATMRKLAVVQLFPDSEFGGEN